MAKQVLVRRELGRIDEHAGCDRVAAPPRLGNQRQMPFVQGAHGGNEPDAFSRVTQAGDLHPQVGHGAYQYEFGDGGHGLRVNLSD